MSFLSNISNTDYNNKIHFQTPEPIGRWNGVKDCTKEGEKNIQIQPLINLAVDGSEDCLHLNVFTKKVRNVKNNMDPINY